MNYTKTLLIAVMTFALLATFAPTAGAQKRSGGDKILVTGAVSLRQSDFDTLTAFYEWLFEARFTVAERRKFQTLIIAEARARPKVAQAVKEIVEGFSKIETVDEAKQQEVRRQFLPEIVGALEKEPGEVNNLLLAVYRNAQGAANDEEIAATDDSPTTNDEPRDEPIRTKGGAVKVGDLAGLWSTSSVSGIRYKSLLTGELSDPSGTIIEYQISPNGTIKHVGYLSITNYTCTSKLFISRTGRVSVSGSTITFDFAPGKRMYQACGSSSRRNDTLPAEREIYSFQLGRDEYGAIQLCTVKDNGEKLCLRKKSD
jgi:hypothetical protein